MTDDINDKHDSNHSDDAKTTFPASATEPEATTLEATTLEAATLAFTVDDGEAGARLDAFLAARVEAVSRTRLKQSIEDGDVLVAGRTALKGSHKLRAGDQVELELPAPPSCDFTPEDIPLDIIYEDDSLVVLNKPAGLVVHPAAGVSSGTLANALAFRFRIPQSAIEESEIRSPQSIRPGIVHRLDRDTSGLMVVAKTARAHEHLSDQFRAREVFKSYVALVHGRVSAESGRIEEPLARDPRTRTRMAVVRGGRPALSLYRVRRAYERFTLLDVQIKTGRTHQIRVHLAHLKHPVVGDKIYNGGRDTTVADVRVRAAIRAMERQFLHAEQLGFRHPQTGETLRFDAPLPPELSQMLDALV
ncbi:MAG TPA: RluA family pseudouridine synthase [Pyrinomonadaceae bacterium]|jgi:23S rRNA pseudouridine1911/1915/1917 synthase|nr:RluA family pseudouridine synthase [Pyrinomonadaceae bacterium]